MIDNEWIEKAATGQLEMRVDDTSEHYKLFIGDEYFCSAPLFIIKEERLPGESWLQMRKRTKELRELREKRIAVGNEIIKLIANSFNACL